MSTKQKSRYFTFILYPDSLKEAGFPTIKEVKQAFESKGLPVAISPLHDKDTNKDRTFKKPHYHVIWIANNPVTAESVRIAIKRLFNDSSDVVSLVQIIKTSVLNTYRYLTHDTPDSIKQGKAQYDEKDIIKVNGFDESRYEAQSVEEKVVIRDAIIQAIRFNRLQNIMDFMMWYDSVEGTDDDFGYSLSAVNDVIASYTGLIKMYFDGAYQIAKREQEKGSLEGQLEQLQQRNEELFNELKSRVEEDK